MRAHVTGVTLAAAFLTAALCADSATAELQFVDATAGARLDVTHSWGADPLTETHAVAGGAAAGDVNGDGWPDLFVVRGDEGPAQLYLNRRDGTFSLASGSGLEIEEPHVVAPLIVDLDGDGRRDVVTGGIFGVAPRVYRNLGGGRFARVEGDMGLWALRDTLSIAAGDYDRDGVVDLFLAHWSRSGPYSPHLFRGNGMGTFDPRDFIAGIATHYQSIDYSFTPRFADLTGDGWPELLIAADFGTSHVWLNQRDGTFSLDPSVLDDENGMGSALGDVDNDGDLDWFVTSIWDPDGVAEAGWGITGNRLYINDGGALVDGSNDAIRQGYWGWGACFADFDNDADLDLFHTNGFPTPLEPSFENDPDRLLLNDGTGFFSDATESVGISTRGQGRGVLCWDYDRDGDVDLFVSNQEGPSVLLRNDLANGYRSVAIDLDGDSSNTSAIGSRLTLQAGATRQVREVQAGNHYVSGSPTTVHFGLGDASPPYELEIEWADGTTSSHVVEEAGQLVVRHPLLPVPIPSSSAVARVVLVLLLALLAVAAVRPGNLS